MTLRGRATRPAILVGESDQAHHHPLVIVDTDERIREFLPLIDEPAMEGLVLLDEAEVVTNAGRSDPHPPERPK